MNESNLWEWLRDIALPLGHYTRIESPETAPGFPDVHYTFKGLSGVIELKYARHVDPPFPDEDSGLRRSQLNWIREEVKAGGSVWILAEINNKDFSVVLCIPGKLAHRFNGADMDQLFELARFQVYRKKPADAVNRLESMFRDR